MDSLCMILTRPMMNGNRPHVMLACFLVSLYVMYAAADGHGIPAFNAAMCLSIDSYFVQCACRSYENTIGELLEVISKFNFTEGAGIYDGIREVQMHEANITDIVTRGVCRSLTEFQTCLDSYMLNSTRVIDRVIMSIVNTDQLEQVLRSAFCTIGEDIRSDVPRCLSDMITGSPACIGLHGLVPGLTTITPNSSDTDESFRNAWCPALVDTTNCIIVQTFGCGQAIHQGVSNMRDGLMTSTCKQTTAVAEPADVKDSAVITCAMPVVVQVGDLVEGDSGTTTPLEISMIISSIIDGVCSRLSHLMDCVEHYLATSANLLDKFVINIIDMGNVKANLQAFSDGYCTSSSRAGIESIVQCMMVPNNTGALTMCFTPELEDAFANFGNTTVLTALDGNSIRHTYCSPLKTYAGCILDSIETKCNETTTQSMIATSRDMLLAILRTDCGGIREEENVDDDNDGATGLHVSMYLLLGLVALLLML